MPRRILVVNASTCEISHGGRGVGLVFQPHCRKFELEAFQSVKQLICMSGHLIQLFVLQLLMSHQLESLSGA